MSQSLPAVLLDTDILSAVMRQHPVALARARAYLAVHQRLTFSIITRYEIRRGLHRRAQRRNCPPLIGSVASVPFCRAATISADLYQRGVLIGDADILIAATGLEHGLLVVINNKSHYQRIAGIQLENWLVELAVLSNTAFQPARCALLALPDWRRVGVMTDLSNPYSRNDRLNADR